MKKVFLGFTVFALAAMVAGPVLAHGYGYGGGGSDITVTNTKTAFVGNSVSVTAATGMNSTDGGYGGDGGDIDDTKAWKGGTATSGNGGNGGKGGNGGSIDTGDAYAKAKTFNIVNTDITEIDPCACCESDPNCDGYEVDDIDVTNTDYAEVGNEVGVQALTDYNTAQGWDGGEGGSIDDTKAWKGGDADSGNGGIGGAGGDGGSVWTGQSKAKAKTFNIVNTIITRIK